MENINHTKFEVPELVVLEFIRNASQFCKKYPIGPKGDKDEGIKESLRLIHHFTYLKFHPYSDHRSGLNSIKDIKEINFTEFVSDKEAVIVTKKNQNTVPACEFRLKLKNNKWKVSNVRVKQGKNNYHTLFVG